MVISSSITSSSYSTNMKQREHFSIEKRPQMLKDFLKDDSNSCSSSGVKSFPRRVEDQSMRNLIQRDLHNASNNSYSSSTKRLLRSRSKAAASTTISALQAIINTVKSIQFNAVKSTSILPRSLSSRLSKKHNPQNNESEIVKTVRVKDIIRWKSFRDLVEGEKTQPSDLASSPDLNHCATTTTGSTNTSCSNSDGSSWCDSDFTSEYLPSWSGNLEEYNEDEGKMGKIILPGVGNHSVKTTTEEETNTAVGPKELLPCKEKEQRSPVSVIDFQYNEDECEDSISSFNRILDNMEKSKQKLMQKIRRFEGLAKVDAFNLEEWMSTEEISDDEKEIIQEEEDEQLNEAEEKARMLLNHVKAVSSIGSCEDNIVERLLLDFFIDELSTMKRDDETDIREMLRLAKVWLDREYSAKIDWEACGIDMDRNSIKWNKFEEAEEETALQIEKGVLNLLVDELLDDLLFC